ncbi:MULTISPECIES: flagellar biosynthesis anti-sigma factor FlgM [Vallitalea]|nr:flagellar biosynthesis anti-sigma factor FlgM [Vallitalea guaymasensis]
MLEKYNGRTGSIMRINGIKNVNNAYKVNQTDRISKVSKVKKEKDSLAISDIAKELQIAKKAVKNAPDIRQDKVNDIKKRIQSGSYNVSAREVADKIVDSYFDKRG